jgi:hypothetical protein
MIHKKKTALLTLGAALVLAAMPLTAQSSQTSVATQEVFTTEADDFLDVFAYGDVEFDTWLGVAGLVTPEGTSDRHFSLGYARKLGGIYLGLGYTGDLFKSAFRNEKSSAVTYDAAGNPLTTTTTEWDGVDDKDHANPNNTVTALLGFGGMGLKLEFTEALKFDGVPASPTTTETETHGENKVVYSNKIDSYSKVYGYITPQITWGMPWGN